MYIIWRMYCIRRHASMHDIYHIARTPYIIVDMFYRMLSKSLAGVADLSGNKNVINIFHA